MDKHRIRAGLLAAATPGPWNDARVGQEGDGSPRSHEEQLCNGEGRAVFIVTHDGSEEARANFLLAAMAPELAHELDQAERMLAEIVAFASAHESLETEGPPWAFASFADDPSQAQVLARFTCEAAAKVLYLELMAQPEDKRNAVVTKYKFPNGEAVTVTFQRDGGMSLIDLLSREKARGDALERELEALRASVPT